MAEGKTNIFGKTYNTIGSTDSNFIIKTKGDLKILWGGKYIDLIKNGKVASSSEKFITKVSSEEDIKGTGIFVTPEDLVLLCIDGTKIDITGISKNTYVSFLEEQQIEDTSIALRNIGFYYKTLLDAENAKKVSGIVYIEDEGCLYLVKNGIYTKYMLGNNILSETDTTDILYIKDDSLFVGNTLYIQCNNEQITAYKNIIAKEGILSEYANQDRGFRLYVYEGKSYLEIDYLKIRNREIQERDLHFPLYSLKDNYAEIITVTEDLSSITITLKDKNEYLVEEFIYLLINQKLVEFQISSIEGLKITILVDPTLIQDIIDYCYNIYLSRSPYIHIEQGNLKVLDRSTEIVNSDTGITNQDEYPHTLIGLVIEKDLEIAEKEDERSKIGIYSDNLIAANPILYNAIFKKFPEYDKETKSPESEQSDEKYNLVVPNIMWIKLLLDLYIPIGSIIMYNGQANIPKGWAICDGNNGTPNLINKFIKSGDGFIIGSTAIGDNSDSIDPSLSEDNKITLTEEHLPKHSHPHKAHTHSAESASSTYVESSEYSYTDTTGEDTQTEYATDYYTGSVSHTHAIQAATSEEANKSWTNKPFSIEPHAYKLIFIMKVSNFAEIINE